MSPTGEHQLLDSALKDCGEELELIIKNLRELNLESAEQCPNIVPAEETVENNQSSSSNSLCAEWADLIVKEMVNAGSLDDARARAFRVLEALTQKSTASSRKEKKNTEALTRQNSILKSAVVIQHKRLNENQRELEDLNKILLQYQDKLRDLEVQNYGLSMHLKQAMGNGAVPGCLHPSDIFF